MKFKRFIGISVLFLLVQPAFAATETMLSETIHPLLPNGTSAPRDDQTDNHAVGSELVSLPASITRYNASLHRPDAKPSKDFNTYGGRLCQLPGFKCIGIRSNQTWVGLWRNEHEREIVMRLNRTNVALRYRKWILVPKDLRSTNYMALSPLPGHIDPTGKKFIVIDLRVFAFGAYNKDGDLVYWGPASGGKTYCSDTNEDCRSAVGEFKIYRIQGENCMSSKYPIDRGGGAPMPYCMHYYKGYAIHGSTLAGFVNGSRGCIRLFYSDAKWLNEDFAKRGTEVIVKG